jgi:uncharacterized OB-fold protein
MPFKLEFPYKRSLGPVIGGFLSGLKERRLLGARTVSGRVLVPPLEYDPESGESTEAELVEVGPGGVVKGFTWNANPTEKQPLDRPFAWALIELDGADTQLLHALAVDSWEAVSTGMRVAPRWRDERRGHISDLECFVPE